MGFLTSLTSVRNRKLGSAILGLAAVPALVGTGIGHHVHSGETLSGIAAASGQSLAQLEARNPQISNPNLIYPGQVVYTGGTRHHAASGYVGHGSGSKIWGVSYGYPYRCGDGDGDGWDKPCGTARSAPAHRYGAHHYSTSPARSTWTPRRTYHHHYASGGGGLADVPGVPRSFAACVAQRESSNGTNQAYNGGVYGIINASGEHVNGQSLSAQKQAFSRLYQRYGKAPWSPSDGC